MTTTDNQLPLIRRLLQDNDITNYARFKALYEDTARHLAQTQERASLATATLTERQYYRWIGGELKSMPRGDASTILTALFPDVPLSALFDPATPEYLGHRIRVSSRDDTVGLTMSAAANASARFAARAESSNVGTHTMELIAADIHRIVTVYPSQPVAPLLREVVTLQDRVFSLLDGRQPPRFTRDLYLAAGVVCGVLANASLDLGNYHAARTQARTALLCGENAGHHGLQSWVCGLQALIAYWSGNPREAVDLAESGAAFTPASGTAHIRLTAIKARAYGQLGEAGLAMTALADAERQRERLVPGDDLPGGMMDFPDAKQRFYSATTHLWLKGRQHVTTACEHAQEAVAEFASAPPGERRLGEESLARVDLATAQLWKNQVDGAASQVHTVLTVDARRSTEGVRKRLAHFGRTLAAHPAASSSAAVALREAIAAHQHSAELPPGGPS